MADLISVVIIDDHPLIRKVIKDTISKRDDIVVAGEGGAGEDVFVTVEKYRPDVLILDLNLPKTSTNRSNSDKFAAIEALSRLNTKYPETSVIILSQEATLPLINAAISNNVRSYLLKNDDLSLNLVDAIDAVLSGGTLFSQKINTILFKRLRQEEQPRLLTKRQIEIIQTLTRWPMKSYVSLAEQLGISESTFKTHLTRIFRVLDVSSATACVVKCMQLGFIPFHLNEMGMVEFDWPDEE